LGHATREVKRLAAGSIHTISATTLAASEFVMKWAPGAPADRLNERAGAQSHFIDLCALLSVPAPSDPASYCFERGLWGVEEGRKFADVWKRSCFAWEYKKPGGDLRSALAQLMQYALPLENPPLLIVSDRRTIQIHTHFTGHPSLMHEVKHENLRDPRQQALLRSAFLTPSDFKPIQTTRDLTAELAGKFARIADALRKRGETPFRAAHFLTQCVFCSFAEDVGILPEHVFRRLVEKRQTPAALRSGLTELFGRMKTGGEFGVDTIPWFNGGLFEVVEVPLLRAEEVSVLLEAASATWQSIDPSILGTLFERGLDPSKRNQLGTHFTDAATIDRLVDPVVRRPLLQEWDGIKRTISGLMSQRDVLSVRARGVPSKTKKLKARHSGIRAAASRAYKQAQDLLSGFMQRLQDFRVLDPACGSGNFLFIALKALKDIEHQVNFDAEELGLERQIPVTGPHNVLGIEVNEYAAELARATVWIGELQWRRQHGYGWKANPILDPLDQIECRDAVLLLGLGEADWPKADVVVGNPPFVGDKKMRSELGDSYTDALRAAYKGRVPGGADLVCYWFEKARAQIEVGALQRAGLVATNSIRGGANREVLDRIVATTRIFEARADEPWVNNGAAVRVSLVGFGKGAVETRTEGALVDCINTDLSAPSQGDASLDLTSASKLTVNARACFMGVTKVGPFDIEGTQAREWLSAPNPHGRPNADVLRPSWNGMDATRRPRDVWIIDFGTEVGEDGAALYAAPFEFATRVIKPYRQTNNREAYRLVWWRHGEARPGLRNLLAPLPRFIATPEVAKHRLFVWVDRAVLPDKNLQVTPRADDATFGILHSRLHELWSLRMCTWMGVGNDPRYTPTTCFETYPFPVGLTPADTAHQRTVALDGGALIPAELSPAARGRAEVIARAAQRLVALRDAWLNPPEWTERVPEVVPIGLLRSSYPDRVVARPGFEKDVAKRTLTALYNARPAWLSRTHEALDVAVANAYGWADYTPSMSDEEVLGRLLRENQERSRTQPGTQLEMVIPEVVRGAPLSRTRAAAGRARQKTKRQA
jgi:SAM-dependent methyltransferase